MARAGKPKWYPRKNWSELKPATRKRHERNGITRQTYYTKSGQSKVRASRGHASTPERPEQARRNPGKYQDYISRRIQEDPETLRQRALARKRKHFADRRQWSRRRGDKMDGATLPTMLKFLAMDELDAENAASAVGQAKLRSVDTVEIDGEIYDVVDWEWLLYH